MRGGLGGSCEELSGSILVNEDSHVPEDGPPPKRWWEKATAACKALEAKCKQLAEMNEMLTSENKSLKVRIKGRRGVFLLTPSCRGRQDELRKYRGSCDDFNTLHVSDYKRMLRIGTDLFAEPEHD